jgi:hypothetical protein
MADGYLCANPAMTLLPALAFGFALGMKHATDPDHIAAIGTLGAGEGGRSARRAAALGAMWGMGHSLSVLLVGGALVLLRLPMPVVIALALEFLVALMLIGLGLLSFRQRGAAVTQSSVRPFLVGVVHGLAGSAVLALLLIGSAAGPAAAALYLVSFGLGTMAGMAIVTTLLTIPARLNPVRAAGIERSLRLGAGVASVVIGLLLAHRVGVREGLFAAALGWNP